MRSKTAYICQDCLKSMRAARHFSKQRKHASTVASRPLRLGIIGSGPAGFYTAARVMQKLPDSRVDMYEKLPVPFGLVRYGVAPDHSEVKNCQDRFEEVANSERFQFIGNVTVGEHIRLAQMKPHYDALLFAYGASKDRLLGIPGENELYGVHAAREFVGWYNGLPEFANLALNLDAEHAVVIGNGNVALDVARILLSSVDSLRHTDIADSALEALSKSRVKRVTIAGRRGPMQAAFTIKELRELVNLPRTAFHADNKELIPSADWISKLPRLEQRKYRFAKLLTEGKKSGDKECQLRSMISPDTFISSKEDGLLSHISFRHTAFRDENARFNPQAQVQLTEESELVEAGLAFRSIGYKAERIEGLGEDLGIDFTESKGIIANDGVGRALKLTHADGAGDGTVAPGCYCTGWVKNGPTGVIATTMEDAFTTADVIINDWTRGAAMLQPKSAFARGWSALNSEPGLEEALSWADWQRIDRFEKQIGREKGGKPRSKLKDVAEMVTTAKMAWAS